MSIIRKTQFDKCHLFLIFHLFTFVRTPLMVNLSCRKRKRWVTYSGDHSCECGCLVLFFQVLKYCDRIPTHTVWVTCFLLKAKLLKLHSQQWQLTAFYIEAAYSLNAKVDMSSTMKAVLAYYFFYQINENECFYKYNVISSPFQVWGTGCFCCQSQSPAAPRQPTKSFYTCGESWESMKCYRAVTQSCCEKVWTLSEL